jgi:hypothetical protein
MILSDVMGGLEMMAHSNAGFAWFPLPKGVRAEPIVGRLR